MERFVCIHGHFYQPPRENPWLEVIEVQDSAYPYHDWNERITAECYAPNALSRILDAQDRITQIVNNYSRISFNFGPTLLSWMEQYAPRGYAAIKEADRESTQRFSGHGSALAQVYNHMIMPLANRADKYTQVLWGIRDFEHRFGRPPEGMWLAETAVDTETLEVLAELGIRFTILAPHQAAAVRALDGGDWQEADGGVDPTMAYIAHLPSGRSINLFFYDGPVSRSIAFEGLLTNGEHLASRLMGLFSDDRRHAQLVHIATDGETYGHHHRHGEMALSYALHHIESKGLARITNYGEFLDLHPPTHEARIRENTSWSCAHGVERWRSNCGCNTGKGFSQEWRGPLRDSLDWLRDEVGPLYERTATQYLKDPWAARNEFIDVVLDRSTGSLDTFLQRHAARELVAHDRVTVLKLLELERHAMLMYTSCGWFFDELSGIETVQVIQYAGRVVQLAREIFHQDFETGFRDRLTAARSNIASFGDGGRIYDMWVKPAIVDLPKVVAHYAISSLFNGYADNAQIYCYQVEHEDYRLQEFGRTRLLLGRVRIQSRITEELSDLSFGVLHLGDHNVNSGVRTFLGEAAYDELVRDASTAFTRADLPEVIRLLDRHFEGITYSLKSLFREEQRKIVSVILDSTLSQAEAGLRQIYDNNATLMRFLSDIGTPLPRVLHVTAEFVLNTTLRREFEQEHFDIERVQALLEAAQTEKVALQHDGLGYALRKAIDRAFDRLKSAPDNIAQIEELETAIQFVDGSGFGVNLWHAQNVYYEIMQQEMAARRARDDDEARAWLAHFRNLGELLRINTAAVEAKMELQAA